MDAQVVAKLDALEKRVAKLAASTTLPALDSGSFLFTGMSSGTVKSTSVTFSKPFDSTPNVTVGCSTSVPQNVSASVSDASATRFTLYACRTDATTSVRVYWIAMA